jgi:hypothetical protein
MCSGTSAATSLLQLPRYQSEVQLVLAQPEECAMLMAADKPEELLHATSARRLPQSW